MSYSVLLHSKHYSIRYDSIAQHTAMNINMC